MSEAWYTVADVDEVPSPALLVYADRVEENLRRMIALAGGVERLRPHVKTHKMPELVRRKLAHGITRFKCATLAEAAMSAGVGATDVLVAYQPVGPNIRALIGLMETFPATRFSTVVDDANTAQALSHGVAAAGQHLDVFLDLDIGMHRTGIAPGAGARELYGLIARLPGLRPAGLHAYDGHLRETDVTGRTTLCDQAFAPVTTLGNELLDAGWPVPSVVAGGSPTFPIHARRPGVECSPGTCVFWDASYGQTLPDLPFVPAALVLSRVVSKPGKNLLCLDLGHKAIASENPPPRAIFLNLPDTTAVSHSEEHLVVACPGAESVPLGLPVYGVPWHICPTVALHARAVVIEQGRTAGVWEVTARDRQLSTLNSQLLNSPAPGSSPR